MAYEKAVDIQVTYQHKCRHESMNERQTKLDKDGKDLRVHFEYSKHEHKIAYLNVTNVTYEKHFEAVPTKR